MGLLALTTTTTIFFHRAHKALYPAAEDERFTHAVILLLSPATTIRAHDVLSRPLLETFHPLALAKTFCPEPEFRAFRAAYCGKSASRVCRSVRWQSRRRRPESQARRAWQQAVEAFLKQCGLNPEELVQPPAPNDDTCRSYCPRCLAQFTANAGTCADCGGVALVAFSPWLRRARGLNQARAARPSDNGTDS